MKCKSCGAEYSPEQTFCRQCGAKLADESTPGPGPEPPAGPGGKRKLIYAGAAVAAIVVIGVVATIALSGGDDDGGSGSKVALEDVIKPEPDESFFEDEGFSGEGPSDAPGDEAEKLERLRQEVKELRQAQKESAAAGGSSSSGESGYIAQLGSYTDRAEAEADAAKLSVRGVEAKILRSDDYDGLRSGYWVVYAGVFPTRSEALGVVSSSGVSDAMPRFVTAK